MTRTMNAHRKQLLTTVSAAALMATVFAGDAAANGDADRPPVWIDLGWHFEQVTGMGDLFDPPFVDQVVAAGFQSPLSIEKRMGFGYGGEGKISFQPEGSDWIFSAAVRYGRAHGRKFVHDQTKSATQFLVLPSRSVPKYPDAARFSETSVSNSETHAILDFQAGKDLGLGMFGGTRGNVNFGIRFAQFNSKSSSAIKADPDFEFYNFKYFTAIHAYLQFQRHHDYLSSSEAERSFRGIGPSLSWNASTPLIGEAEDGQLTLDWGINAALLFGRQKTRTRHQTTGYSYREKYRFSGVGVATLYRHSYSDSRSRSVTVPNLGGFAGLSVRYSDVKFSIAYRADMFFGAIDGGIDARHSTTRGFNGPFASISVGMGD